ncbi:HAMP domain-containing histidine kinase [Occultella glacieicola]|uniref:Sensor histidine kinase MtrB n=1 Tax=Occultella glacieicola TaxID=2518684 RepID=A0ABY2E687_9MICO|nr:MtrAB system histidine kinase MtrB [Occultella glacieicola]TDE96095.1 HAMP domain-containing histidine kinase [Occultella glacieicola]
MTDAARGAHPPGDAPTPGRRDDWFARVRHHAERWRRVLRVRVRLALRVWRGSLRLRVASTTVAVGVIALALLGLLLSAQIRDGLFDDRRDQVLSDAATRAELAQGQFDASTVSSAQEVQQLATDMVSGLQETSVGSSGVFLMRSPGSPAVILDPSTNDSLRPLISPELRERVQTEDFQAWQSVGIPRSDGGLTPGIAVGSAVTLPLAGDYELYLIYSLGAEQQNLDLLQGVLAVGAVSLVVLLLAMAWYLTRQVLDPVEQAARTAGRLADGHLTERMQVRGDDELALLGRSFNEMAASLQDQIERMANLSHMQQRFVSDVSHELRTPLTTVRMASEVLYQARGDFTPGQARSAELLQAQLDRFEELLADLLEISRFDAGAATLEAEGVDVREVVRRVVDLTAPLAQNRGSEVVLDLPAIAATADIDQRRVERVLRNLIVNAIEHGEGEPIDVRVGVNARAVAVVVRDHGIGMTAPEAEHVFDRFWRADPARARTLGGTGLGLAISLEDARLHGGDLEAWGSPGEGAAFRLTLPRRAGLDIAAKPIPLREVRSEPELEPPEDSSAANPAALPDLHPEPSTSHEEAKG